jgi:DNA-directed RNA polymerase specialized sigma24 family protein
VYDPNAPSSQEVVALLKTQRVQRVLHKIAKWCTKSEADAEDLTADALACVIDSDDSPWIPAKGTFLTHMTFVMRHIWDQQMRSGRAKHEIAVEDVTRDKMTLSREPRADDELHRHRTLDVERKLAVQLLAEIGGEHPIAKRCILVVIAWMMNLPSLNGEPSCLGRSLVQA